MLKSGVSRITLVPPLTHLLRPDIHSLSSKAMMENEVRPFNVNACFGLVV